MTVKMSLLSHELKKSKRMRLIVLVCDHVKTDIIIGLPSIRAYNLLPVLTECGDEGAEQAAELQDVARMTDSSSGIRYIETARATNEEKRTYTTEQNHERDRDEAGAPAQHSAYVGDMETLYA